MSDVVREPDEAIGESVVEITKVAKQDASSKSRVDLYCVSPFGRLGEGARDRSFRARNTQIAPMK